MAAPEIRAVGAITQGTVAITLGPAAGIEVGDLLIAIFESGGPTVGTAATTPLTASGWTSAPSSPQQIGNTRLTILYRIATGSDACTTNDTGDHQAGRMIAIKKDTFNVAEPFNASAGSTQAATKAVSIPGATTTVAECLILAACSGHLPDAASTTEFSEWANASLASVTEQIDNTRTDGDGWALGAATGVKATAGAYGATTATAVTEAERGVISLAINPPGKEVKATATVGGGGDASASTTTLRSGTAQVQGGGDGSATGASQRFSAVVVGGGGTGTVASSKAASAAVVVSGGGAVEAAGEKAAEVAATVEGGGEATGTGTKQAEAEVEVGGGGDISADGAGEEEARVAVVGGGGDVNAATATVRFGAAVVGGGGDAVVEIFRTPPSRAISRPPQPGRAVRGYSGGMSGGRRGSVTRGDQ